MADVIQFPVKNKRQKTAQEDPLLRFVKEIGKIIAVNAIDKNVSLFYVQVYLTVLYKNMIESGVEYEDEYLRRLLSDQDYIDGLIDAFFSEIGPKT